MRIPSVTWAVEPTSYDEDLLLDIEIIVVALLVRGRNAWNSTWVRHYLRNADLYSSLRSAMEAAEPRRGPGNVFYVTEVPGIILRGARSTVVVTDTHHDVPFGKYLGLEVKRQPSKHGVWLDGLHLGVSVQDAIKTFRHDAGHWRGSAPDEASLRTGQLPQGYESISPRRRLKSLQSVPRRAGQPLGWISTDLESRFSFAGTQALVAGWATLRREMGQDAATSADLETSLAKYRDSILRAQPAAVWALEKNRYERAAIRLQVEKKVQVGAAERALRQLVSSIDEAKMALRAAQTARFPVAATSAGMRAQRERVEHAEAMIAQLLTERESLATSLASARAALQQVIEDEPDDDYVSSSRPTTSLPGDTSQPD